MQLALAQVRVRQATLFDGKEFWRTRNDDGQRGNRNWARGIAWQILGLARTLNLAKDRNDIADLIASLRQFAAWAIALQREDGLWSVFADEPKLTPDGLLGGVSQPNKGGEVLQRGDYRTIYQMGMGLMAQLEAALYREAD